MFTEVVALGQRRLALAFAFNSGRAVEFELPSWSVFVLLADIALFLPLWLFVGYTMNALFPVLAMVEDDDPPSYQSVATTLPAADEGEAGPLPTKTAADPLPTKTDGSPRAATSSLRLTRRLVRAQTAGPRAYFHGLPVYIAYSVALSFLSGTLASFLPGPFSVVAILLATLALVQLRTAWVHTVMTVRSPLPFWRRLPPFKSTFRASAKPTALVFVAYLVGSIAPTMSLNCLLIHAPTKYEQVDFDVSWKSLVLLLTLPAQLLILIPAEVILTRVQASLLPEDQETIVPFDRSFQGTVEPAVVSGKGYVSMSDAWSTFSHQAWRRLMIMYIKIFGVTIASWLLMALVIIPEMFLILAYANEKQD